MKHGAAAIDYEIVQAAAANEVIARAGDAAWKAGVRVKTTAAGTTDHLGFIAENARPPTVVVDGKLGIKVGRLEVVKAHDASVAWLFWLYPKPFWKDGIPIRIWEELCRPHRTVPWRRRYRDAPRRKRVTIATSASATHSLLVSVADR